MPELSLVDWKAAVRSAVERALEHHHDGPAVCNRTWLTADLLRGLAPLTPMLEFQQQMKRIARDMDNAAECELEEVWPK